MSQETTEMLMKRFKALAWTIGTFAVLSFVNFLSDNLLSFGLPTYSVAVISLILNQITKELNK
jgi:hypothetical protein